MSPVTSLASDRRFRRAQVTPIRRRSKWYALAKRTLHWAVVAAAGGYAAAHAPALAARTHMLRVDGILVHGNQRLSEGDVLAVLTGLRGESLGYLDQLTGAQTVSDAPGRVLVPGEPEAEAERRSDDRGIIIDQYGPQYAQFDLPMIDGLSASPAEGGTMTDGARAELAARVIAAVAARPAIARRLSQIDVTDAHNASVILSGDPAVIRLGDDRFLQRVEAYIQLAPALRERVSEIDYVDLRFDDRIYVRPVNAKATRPSVAGRSTGRRR